MYLRFFKYLKLQSTHDILKL